MSHYPVHTEVNVMEVHPSYVREAIERVKMNGSPGGILFWNSTVTSVQWQPDLNCYQVFITITRNCPYPYMENELRKMMDHYQTRTK